MMVWTDCSTTEHPCLYIREGPSDPDVQIVGRIVIWQTSIGLLRVLVHKAWKRFGACRRPPLPAVPWRIGGQGRPAAQELGPLSDVDPLVAIRSRSTAILMQPTDEPQITGHGLIQGEQAQRLPIDIDLEQIDFLIAFDDFIRQRSSVQEGLCMAFCRALSVSAAICRIIIRALQILEKTTLQELTS